MVCRLCRGTLFWDLGSPSVVILIGILEILIHGKTPYPRSLVLVRMHLTARRTPLGCRYKISRTRSTPIQRLIRRPSSPLIVFLRSAESLWARGLLSPWSLSPSFPSLPRNPGLGFRDPVESTSLDPKTLAFPSLRRRRMEDYPEELRTPPVSLVSLVGCPELHHAISAFLHSEQPPINTLALPDFSKISVLARKQKDPLASTAPAAGILKRNWLLKHRTKIPAVAATLFSSEQVTGDPAQWLQLCTDLENLKYGSLPLRICVLLCYFVHRSVASNGKKKDELCANFNFFQPLIWLLTSLA